VGLTSYDLRGVAACGKILTGKAIFAIFSAQFSLESRLISRKRPFLLLWHGWRSLNRRASRVNFRYDTGGTYCRMSLKAKLEAVIYAAEEPVTLAQLAALFAADAFEWKAQQEAALAKQAADAASEAAQSLPPASEEAAFLELELEPVDSDPSEPVSVAAAEQIPVVEQVPVMGQASAVEPMPGASREAGLEAGPDSRADCRVDSTVDFRVGSSADSGSKPGVEALAGRGPGASPESEPETNLEASQTAGFSAPPTGADAPKPAEDGPSPNSKSAARHACAIERSAPFCARFWTNLSPPAPPTTAAWRFARSPAATAWPPSPSATTPSGFL
jgi:hypothetical protein